jgi:hypothetical protein
MSTQLTTRLACSTRTGWVREEVHARLSQYESADGKLSMRVEMLIGSGRK